MAHSSSSGPRSAGTQSMAVAMPKVELAMLSYLAAYRASPLERIDMIRRGIPASEAKRIFADLPIGQGAALAALNLSAATVSAWIRSMASALLRVPSVIAPDEYNVLINPLPPDSSAIVAEKIRKFLYDPRLTKAG